MITDDNVEMLLMTARVISQRPRPQQQLPMNQNELKQKDTVTVKEKHTKRRCLRYVLLGQWSSCVVAYYYEKMMEEEEEENGLTCLMMIQFKCALAERAVCASTQLFN